MEHHQPKSIPSTSTAIIISAFLFSMAIVAATFLIGEAAKKVVPSNQVVKVRGVAERTIESDSVNWSLTVSFFGKTIQKSYENVDLGIEKVTQALKQNKVSSEAINLTAYTQYRRTKTVTLDKIGNTRTDLIGYEVNRTVELKDLKDLDLIEKLSKTLAGNLQRQGINVTASSPYYFFSKDVNDIKPALLEQAAKSAYQRATIVAKSSGSSLGPLKAARQGSFNGMGDDGFVGGSTRSHRISAVVTVDYALE